MINDGIQRRRNEIKNYIRQNLAARGGEDAALFFEMISFRLDEEIRLIEPSQLSKTRIRVDLAEKMRKEQREWMSGGSVATPAIPVSTGFSHEPSVFSHAGAAAADDPPRSRSTSILHEYLIKHQAQDEEDEDQMFRRPPRARSVSCDVFRGPTPQPSGRVEILRTPQPGATPEPEPRPPAPPPVPRFRPPLEQVAIPATVISAGKTPAPAPTARGIKKTTKKRARPASGPKTRNPAPPHRKKHVIRTLRLLHEANMDDGVRQGRPTGGVKAPDFGNVIYMQSGPFYTVFDRVKGQKKLMQRVEANVRFFDINFCQNPGARIYIASLSIQSLRRIRSVFDERTQHNIEFMILKGCFTTKQPVSKPNFVLVMIAVVGKIADCRIRKRNGDTLLTHRGVLFNTDRLFFLLKCVNEELVKKVKNGTRARYLFLNLLSNAKRTNIIGLVDKSEGGDDKSYHLLMPSTQPFTSRGSVRGSTDYARGELIREKGDVYTVNRDEECDPSSEEAESGDEADEADSDDGGRFEDVLKVCRRKPPTPAPAMRKPRPRFLSEGSAPARRKPRDSDEDEEDSDSDEDEYKGESEGSAGESPVEDDEEDEDEDEEDAGEGEGDAGESEEEGEEDDEDMPEEKGGSPPEVQLVRVSTAEEVAAEDARRALVEPEPVAPIARPTRPTPSYPRYGPGEFMGRYWVMLHPQLGASGRITKGPGWCSLVGDTGSFRFDESENVDRLRTDEWLNDDVVGAYMTLLQIRQESPESPDTEPLPVCMFFSSQFYAMIECDYHYSSVKRWARKTRDWAAAEIFIVPINRNNAHWCLIAAFLQAKHIRYYDSQGGNSVACMVTIEAYLNDVGKFHGVPAFVGEWDKRSVGPRQIPRQDDGSSCGLFACAAADCISRGRDPSGYTQADMRAMRAGFLRFLGF
jgi:hypothetical protein